MTLHKQFFDIYEPLSGRNLFMGNKDILEVVGKGFILVETCEGLCTKH